MHLKKKPISGLPRNVTTIKYGNRERKLHVYIYIYFNATR